MKNEEKELKTNEGEQLQNNEMIANFMGWIWPQDETHKKYEIGNLKYHYSWDSLMPVIEKIEGLGHPTYTRNAEIYIKENSTMSSKSIVTVLEGRKNSKIQAYYKAAILFIRWYNERKSAEG